MRKKRCVSPKMGLAGRLVGVVAAGSMSLALGAQSAGAAHFIDADSVDGGEIRYENETKYDASLAFGVEQWNALGKTDLKKDSAFTFADLQVQDQSKPKGAWAGLYTPSSGADEIYLNTYYLDQYDTTHKRVVVAHELGHAYGLGDHEKVGYANTLMYAYMNDVNTPRTHDVSDWKQEWK
jgi:hypothetical protein